MDFTQLILIAPLIPLVASVLLLLGRLLGFPGNGRLLAVLAVLTGAACCLVGGSVPEETWGLWSVNNSSGERPVGLRLEVTSRLSFVWILILHWLALLLFLWPADDEGDRESVCHESVMGLLLLAVSQGGVLSTEAWTQWVLVALSGWAFGMLVMGMLPGAPRNDENRDRFRGVRRGLVTLAVADFLWMIGLLPLLHGFGSLALPDLLAVAERGELSPLQQSAAVGGSFWLLCALMIRCGLFPLMGWIGELALSPRTVAWMIAFPLGQGLFLLLRWYPLLLTSEPQQMLIAGVAGLSALLLAAMGFGRKSASHQLVRVTGGFVALAWLGLVAMPHQAPRFAAFSLAMLLLLPWLVMRCGEERKAGSQGDQEQGDSAVSAPLLTVSSTSSLSRIAFGPSLAIGLIVSGCLGQEWIFDAVRAAVRTSQGRFPAALLAVVLISHGLLSYVLIRRLFAIGTRPVGPRPGRMRWLSGVTVGFALLTLLLPAYLDLTDVLQFPIPGATLILGLMALVAARSWSGAVGGDPGTQAVLRLSDEEFYSQRMINDGLLRTIAGIAALVRLMDWLGIDRVVLAWPRAWCARLSDSAALADEETSSLQAAVTLLLSVVVLIVAVVLVRSGGFP